MILQGLKNLDLKIMHKNIAENKTYAAEEFTIEGESLLNKTFTGEVSKFPNFKERRMKFL